MGVLSNLMHLPLVPSTPVLFWQHLNATSVAPAMRTAPPRTRNNTGVSLPSPHDHTHAHTRTSSQRRAVLAEQRHLRRPARIQRHQQSRHVRELAQRLVANNGGVGLRGVVVH